MKENTVKLLPIYRHILYIIFVLSLSSCVKYEVETFLLDDTDKTFIYFDYYNYPYKDEWILVGGYIAIEMDSFAWGETYDTIFFSQRDRAIFINTYLGIDTARIGMIWKIYDDKIIANDIPYDYNFIRYSNIIDVNTTPSKRAYEIIDINEYNMVIRTPRQYIDVSGALQTRESTLEFERIY